MFCSTCPWQDVYVIVHAVMFSWDLQLAFSIWTRPIVQGMLPNEEDYTVLMEACCLCKQVWHACTGLGVGSEGSGSVTIAGYSRKRDGAIRTDVELHQGFKALQVLDAIKRAGHQPTQQHYALVLAALQSSTSLHSSTKASDELVSLWRSSMLKCRCDNFESPR